MRGWQGTAHMTPHPSLPATLHQKHPFTPTKDLGWQKRASARGERALGTSKQGDGGDHCWDGLSPSKAGCHSSSHLCWNHEEKTGGWWLSPHPGEVPSWAPGTETPGRAGLSMAQHGCDSRGGGDIEARAVSHPPPCLPPPLDFASRGCSGQ